MPKLALLFVLALVGCSSSGGSGTTGTGPSDSIVTPGPGGAPTTAPPTGQPTGNATTKTAKLSFSLKRVN